VTDLLPDHLFADPIRSALHGPHRHLAIGGELAHRCAIALYQRLGLVIRREITITRVVAH
jgi:hypothetical protein